MTSALSNLPAPLLLEELSFEASFEEMRTKLISLDTAYSAFTESDPVYKILQVAAYFRVLDRQRVNEAAAATLLAYAKKSDLDHRAAGFNVFRKLITPANEDAVPPVEAVYETDDDLRARTLLAFEGITTAGSKGAYRFHALSAHADVIDADVDSPKEGEILVTLLGGSGAVSQTVIDTVTAALNAENVRPDTDKVTVQSVVSVDYQIAAVVYLESSPSSEAVKSQVLSNADEFVISKKKLGAAVRMNALNAILFEKGVENVVLSSPTSDLVLTGAQVSNCTSVNITFAEA